MPKKIEPLSEEFLALTQARQWLECMIGEYNIDPACSLMQVMQQLPDGTITGTRIIRLSDLFKTMDRLKVPPSKLPSNTND